MRYGDTWRPGQQSGGPAVTITPPAPMRDRAQRLVAYEVWKLDQAARTPQPEPERVGGAS